LKVQSLAVVTRAAAGCSVHAAGHDKRRGLLRVGLEVDLDRERHSTLGAKSDAADAHLLAEIVRVDRAHHRPLAGDSAAGEAIKMTARSHQSLVWDRTRHVLGLRSTLREFFPAALKAFRDLDAPDTLELLARAPGPDKAARLTKSRIIAALSAARRHHVETKATEIAAILREDQLRQPPPIQSPYEAVVSSEVAIIAALNTQIDQLGTVVAAHFGPHPNAGMYTSQPGLGTILAARVLGEFGDDPHRYRDAKARKNYAGTSPITRSSGTRKVVLARYARNRRLADALQQWAFSAMRGSPGAKTYYQQLRARNIGHQAALRQLANRVVGILHGCLKTHTRYDEHTAWPTSQQLPLDFKEPGMSAASGASRDPSAPTETGRPDSGVPACRDPAGEDLLPLRSLQRGPQGLLRGPQGFL